MLTAALVIALSLSATPQTDAPSFDCARASTVVEHAICKDADLARLDRRIAARFSVLRRELDPPARAALLEDQRGYLWSRDEVFNAEMPEPERSHWLSRTMRGRAEFLDSVSTTPRAGLTGYWANFMGEAFVSQRADGTLRIRALAAEPTAGRWTCDFDVNARPVGATAQGIPADTPDTEFGGDWAINLEREGVLLKVDECCQAGHCGMNGTISGLYLPLGGGVPVRLRD